MEESIVHELIGDISDTFSKHASAISDLTEIVKEELSVVTEEELEENVGKCYEFIEETNSLVALLKQRQEQISLEVGMIQENVDDQLKKIESQEKLAEEREKQVNNSKMKLSQFREQQIKSRADLQKEFKEKQCEILHKRNEAVCKDIELAERKLEKMAKENELMEKQMEESFRKLGLKENSMDGKFLQIFLNENHDKHDTSMPHVAAFAIQQSVHPAKFVLEAIQGFYPPHLMNGDRKFETHVVRSSCVIILEQLMKLSPTIGPEVDKEAKEVVHEWEDKMTGDVVEVLGLLLMLGAYKFRSLLDDDVLSASLIYVAHYPQVHQLREVLGIRDENYGT